MDAKADELKVTGHVEILFKCTWTIPRFSLLDAPVGKKRNSEVFKLEEGALEWFITVYPGGIYEPDKGFVSCFFFVGNKPEGVKCKYSLSFLNTNDEVLFNGKSDEWIVCKDDGYGYKKTLKADELKSKLIDDTLIVTVDVTYFVTPVEDCVSIHNGAGVSPKIKVTEDLQSLWLSKRYSDFIISVGGRDIPVHSAVLCARSKVFAAMFEHETLEKETRRVEVTDFESNTMASFMEYIYSGSVSDMGFELALELLRASDKYGVDDMKLYCYRYLKPLLNNENICQVLLSADIYNAEKLRSHAIDYFCKNLTVEHFESQRRHLETRPRLLSDIIVKGMIERF